MPGGGSLQTVKIPLLVRLVAALACFGSFTLNAALTEEDCRKLLADKIAAEGEGRIKLGAFKTTKLVQMLIKDEVPIRGCEYVAELEFLEDTKWNVHPGIEFKDFKTWKTVSATRSGFDPAKFNEEINHPGLDFTRGSRTRIVGTMTSWYREKKWGEPEIVGGILPPQIEAAEAKGLGSRERAALSAKCLENLKQLGLAVWIYRTDEKSMMPATLVQLTNEVSNATLTICPSDVLRADILKLESGTQWPEVTKWGSSYLLEWAGKNADLRADGDVMIRCPIHGHFCNFKGKVIEKFPDGSLGPPR